MWLYRKICQYRNDGTAYFRISTNEIENTEEGENTEHGQKEQSEAQPDFYTLMTSLALLSIILAYFYLCDRYKVA